MDGEEPGDRLIVLLDLTVIMMLFAAAWLAMVFEVVPGVVTHDVEPCALDG